MLGPAINSSDWTVTHPQKETFDFNFPSWLEKSNTEQIDYHINRLYTKYGDGQILEDRSLTVLGHKLRIPKSSGVVCEFTFDQLCAEGLGEPLGAQGIGLSNIVLKVWKTNVRLRVSTRYPQHKMSFCRHWQTDMRLFSIGRWVWCSNRSRCSSSRFIFDELNDKAVYHNDWSDLW